MFQTPKGAAHVRLADVRAGMVHWLTDGVITEATHDDNGVSVVIAGDGRYYYPYSGQITTLLIESK